MDIFFRVVVVAVALVVVWFALQPRLVFVLWIEGATVRVARGKVAARILQEVVAVCQEAGVEKGRVWGVLQGRRVALRFSRSIPPGCRQRLRNLWNLLA